MGWICLTGCNLQKSALVETNVLIIPATPPFLFERNPALVQSQLRDRLKKIKPTALVLIKAEEQKHWASYAVPGCLATTTDSPSTNLP